ncbi:MAG TPA: heme-binding domain-containing protein [Pyrinomonadaceae bacterium]|nr:heme-binding domain-containing protein [Pyrinomonadaceae bacterium]
MSKAWRVLKWLFLIVVILLVAAQFVRPAKTNPAADPSLSIESQAQVTPAVASIFDRSCNDCHSNNTRWPWYSNVAPVSWFVIDHVNEARGDMNLSEWGKLDRNRQRHRLEDMCEMVQSGEMPLSSYTPLHPGSKLSQADVKALCDWSSSERQRLSSLPQ